MSMCAAHHRIFHNIGGCVKMTNANLKSPARMVVSLICLFCRLLTCSLVAANSRHSRGTRQRSKALTGLLLLTLTWHTTTISLSHLAVLFRKRTLRLLPSVPGFTVKTSEESPGSCGAKFWREPSHFIFTKYKKKCISANFTVCFVFTKVCHIL